MTPPVLFLAAGEVSGDVHGAALAKALLAQEPSLRLMGWGSHRMADAGVDLEADLVAHAAVGLTENLASVVPSWRALRAARRRLAEVRPAAVVLIDFQGANMALARMARGLGLPTIYYISPQEWIWGLASGPRKVAEGVDEILAIFAREAEVYREAGGQVTFVGHPLLDLQPDAAAIANIRRHVGGASPVLGLFPGSRAQEVERLLPPFLEAAALLQERTPGLGVVLPVAAPHVTDLVDAALRAAGWQVGMEPGPRKVLRFAGVPGMAVMGTCDALLAASGTVTLEAAVMRVPVVAAYKVSAMTAFAARRLLRIPYVTLPNIVAQRGIIPELLQEAVTPSALADAVAPLLHAGLPRNAHLEGLDAVRTQLGEQGAVARAAARILQRAGLAARPSVGQA
ncbi:MAG: lipid-A-disaccharide synthase [Candidatus Sericytochromatia bacterium]|nr:lipid-A-disaccharide synthase [Candidatus Tanganyikabacteria bacterium]